MKSQSACHFCSWKEHCFPSKAAEVQETAETQSPYRPQHFASVFDPSVCLTTITTAQTKHHHPPTHTRLSLFSKISLHKEAFAPEKETWEKRVKVLAANTYKLYG